MCCLFVWEQIVNSDFTWLFQSTCSSAKRKWILFFTFHAYSCYLITTVVVASSIAGADLITHASPMLFNASFYTVTSPVAVLVHTRCWTPLIASRAVPSAFTIVNKTIPRIHVTWFAGIVDSATVNIAFRRTIVAEESVNTLPAAACSVRFVTIYFTRTRIAVVIAVDVTIHSPFALFAGNTLPARAARLTSVIETFSSTRRSEISIITTVLACTICLSTYVSHAVSTFHGAVFTPVILHTPLTYGIMSSTYLVQAIWWARLIAKFASEAIATICEYNQLSIYVIILNV